jgi:hypothetical protein
MSMTLHEKLDKILAMLEQLVPEPEPEPCNHTVMNQKPNAAGEVLCSTCDMVVYKV